MGIYLTSGKILTDILQKKPPERQINGIIIPVAEGSSEPDGSKNLWTLDPKRGKIKLARNGKGM